MRLFRFRLGDYSTNKNFMQDFFLFICYNIDMLISEKNEYGVVTIDDGLFFQLFAEALVHRKNARDLQILTCRQ